MLEIFFFQPIRIEFSKISKETSKSQSRQKTHAISVDIDQLYNKQMNEINARIEGGLEQF